MFGAPRATNHPATGGRVLRRSTLQHPACSGLSGLQMELQWAFGAGAVDEPLDPHLTSTLVLGATRCSSSHFHLTRWNVRPNSIRFWIYASSSHAKLCLSPRVHRHLWFLTSVLKLSGQRRAAMAQRRCVAPLLLLLLLQGIPTGGPIPVFLSQPRKSRGFSCSAGFFCLVSTRSRLASPAAGLDRSHPPDPG